MRTEEQRQSDTYDLQTLIAGEWVTDKTFKTLDAANEYFNSHSYPRYTRILCNTYKIDEREGYSR